MMFILRSLPRLSLWLASFLAAAHLGAAMTEDLLTTARLVMTTDRAEKNTSRTEASMEQRDGVVTIRYHIPEHVELRYAYVALEVRPAQPVGAGLTTLEFDARIDEGSAQPYSLSVRTASGRGYRREYRGYGDLGTEWQTVRLPLSDLTVPAHDRTGIAFLQFTVACHSMRDQIDLQEGAIHLRNLRLTSDPVEGAVRLPDYKRLLEGRPRFSRARSHAAWLYTPNPRFLDEIRAFNARSHLKIDQFYVAATELAMKGGRPHLPPFNADVEWYIRNAPAGTAVHAMIASGQGRALGELPAEEQAALAREIAARARAIPGLAGVHFDIEPYVVDSLPFYVAFKEAYDGVVSAALDRWDEHVMWVVDQPVVMAYGKARDPRRFAASAFKMIRDFGEDSARVGRSYLPGVAMAQTNLEYEYELNAATGVRDYTGAQMEDYTRGILEKLVALDADPYFGGLAIWAFMPEETKIFRDFPKHPRHIKPECYEALHAFSEKVK